LPGAYATLGSVAAHRGQWIAAEEEFRRAFALDDQSGRVHARHAKTVLMSAGRLDAARQKFLAELRLTPGSARGAMQVATAIGMHPGHEAEALKFVDIALSIGMPADARDVRQLYSLFALRAGRHAEAAEYRTLAMPESMREAGGRDAASLLYAAMKSPAQREKALVSIDALARRLTDSGATSFDSVMFRINGYTMLGDLDRAYAASAQWLQLSASSGLSGIPFTAGFWLHEMRAFRADPRFEALAAGMGLMEYWREFGAPDDCDLREKLVCGAGARPGG
jgi:tetratricopeptide (TPR) repeat protein